MHVWNVLHAARWKYRTQKSPFRRHRTTLSACIFAAKACIDNRKKNLLNADTSSTRSHNMVNFRLLTAEIRWRVWGTPANFSGLRVLAALLHSNLVVGVSQTCGVEQRVPPIFGRAAITLGIGPHSSFPCFILWLVRWVYCVSSHWINVSALNVAHLFVFWRTVRRYFLSGG